MLLSYIRNVRENIKSTLLKRKERPGRLISFLECQFGKDNSFFGIKTYSRDLLFFLEKSLCQFLEKLA